jgi:hypothetical protein
MVGRGQTRPTINLEIKMVPKSTEEYLTRVEYDKMTDRQAVKSRWFVSVMVTFLTILAAGFCTFTLSQVKADAEQDTKIENLESTITTIDQRTQDIQKNVVDILIHVKHP